MKYSYSCFAMNYEVFQLYQKNLVQFTESQEWRWGHFQTFSTFGGSLTPPLIAKREPNEELCHY